MFVGNEPSWVSFLFKHHATVTDQNLVIEVTIFALLYNHPFLTCSLPCLQQGVEKASQASVKGQGYAGEGGVKPLVTKEVAEIVQDLATMNLNLKTDGDGALNFISEQLKMIVDPLNCHEAMASCGWAAREMLEAHMIDIILPASRNPKPVES